MHKFFNNLSGGNGMNDLLKVIYILLVEIQDELEFIKRTHGIKNKRLISEVVKIKQILQNYRGGLK